MGVSHSQTTEEKLEILFESKEKWISGIQLTHVFYRMGLLAWFQCWNCPVFKDRRVGRKEHLGEDSGEEGTQEIGY